MTAPTARTAPYTAREFRYLDVEIDAATDTLSCHYALDDWRFTEQVRLPGGGDWSTPAAVEAARLVFLLAGVSYYKAGAPPLIDLGEHALTDRELSFLREYYIDGLGEFAYRSDPRLDLSGLEIRAPRLERAAPVGFSPRPGTPLIPFGGGVDSIVTVELLRATAPGASLFVVNRPGDRFDAIEQPAQVAGLPVVRAERTLDPQILRSAELGFRNGHVPVTGVISAIAVLAAAVGGHSAVVMSNEWSASVGTVELDGRSVNHQYSKSVAFERGLRGVLADAIGGDGAAGGGAGGAASNSLALQYFSMLRPFSGLWIAERFARLPQYFGTFRSCNRAFHINLAHRYDHWCGRCDNCCFVDLILAPFVDAADLRQVFAAAGSEPLENPELRGQFENLVGLVPDAKPWECVGDVEESAVAMCLAAARPDRRGASMVQELAARVSSGVAARAGDLATARAELLTPVGDHFIPEAYLPAGLLRAAPEHTDEP